MEAITVQADDIETKFDVWLAGSVMSTAMAGILMLWFGSLDMLMTAPERKVRSAFSC